MSERIKSITDALTGALPREAEARDELAALGIIATGIICQAEPDERAELVETFCGILRKSCASDFN